MKILHIADLHLGSEMSTRFTAEKARIRKEELCAAFHRAVEYAIEIGAQAVLLCGDMFDTAAPLRRDKQFFYDVIRQAPQLTFFYLKGNHDEEENREDLPNLKTFSEQEWTSYDLGEGVCVSGIELSDENGERYYDDLSLDAEKKNIVLLHGQLSEGVGARKIVLRKLAGKGIDYLALGHIHGYSAGAIDARGKYAYAGCLEPRGFDEVGEKGFIILDTDGGVRYRFMESASRTVRLVEVDISGDSGMSDALQTVEDALTVDKEDMPRILLKGEVDFDTDGLANFIEARLRSRYFAVSVKDETCPALHIEKYEGQVSLEAEFVRVILADETVDEGEKRRVIALGLKALKGEKL